MKKLELIEHEIDLPDFSDLFKDLDLDFPGEVDLINPFNPFSGKALKNHVYLNPDKKALSIEVFTSDPDTFKVILTELKKTVQRLNISTLQRKGGKK